MSGERDIGLRGKEYADFAKTKTFGSLDGLRAIAILAVVWHHTTEHVQGWNITSRGFLGVRSLLHDQRFPDRDVPAARAETHDTAFVIVLSSRESSRLGVSDDPRSDPRNE